MRKQEIKSMIATFLCVAILLGCLHLDSGLFGSFSAAAEDDSVKNFNISLNEDCNPEQFVLLSNMYHNRIFYSFNEDLFAVADYKPASVELDFVSNSNGLMGGIYVIDSAGEWIQAQNQSDYFWSADVSDVHMHKYTYRQDIDIESHGLIFNPWWIGDCYDEEEKSHVSLTYMTEFRLLDEEGNVLVSKSLSEYVENDIEISYGEDEYSYMVFYYGEQITLSPVINSSANISLHYEWTADMDMIENGKTVQKTVVVGNEPQLNVTKTGNYTLRVYDDYYNSSNLNYDIQCFDGLNVFVNDADEYFYKWKWNEEGDNYFKTAFSGGDIQLSPSVSGENIKIEKYEWYKAEYEYEEIATSEYGLFENISPEDVNWSLVGTDSSYSIKNWNGDKNNPDSNIYKFIAYDSIGNFDSVIYWLGSYYVDDSSIDGNCGEVKKESTIKIESIVDKQNMLYYLWYGDYYADENGNYDYLPDEVTYTEYPEIDVTIGRSGFSGSPNHWFNVYNPANENIFTSYFDIYAMDSEVTNPLKIVSRPKESIRVKPGETVKLHVSVEGCENPQYQWYVATYDGPYVFVPDVEAPFKKSNMTGNKTDTLIVKATEARNGYTFYCVICDESGNRVESNTCTIYVDPLPLNGITVYSDGKEVEDNPALHGLRGDDITGYTTDWVDVLSDRNIAIKLNADGDDLSYQWYVSKDGGETWKKSGLTGNKTDTIRFKSDMSRYGYFFKCVVSDSNGNTRESDEFGIRIDVIGVMAKAYSETYRNGENVTLDFGDALGLGLSYQWECSKDGGKTWVNSGLKGNKTPVLSFTATPSRDGYMFRYKLTNGSGKVCYSPEIDIHVEPINVIKQPMITRNIVGDTAVLSVDAIGDGLTYQWQASKDMGKTWTNSAFSGNKTKELSVKATLARDGYMFRCVIIDKNGNRKSSNGVIFHVSDSIITSEPVSKTVTAGTTAKFTVEAKEGSSYQWQVSTDNGKTWKNSGMSGNKTAELKVSATAGRNGYMFRCVVKNNFFTQTSEDVKLTVK